MRKGKWVIGVAMVLSLLFPGTEIWACPVAGPNGHIGEALSVSPSAQAIQIRDAETGNPLTFKATLEQLSGISPGDQVLIKYKKTGESLIAEEVKKLQ